MFSSKTSSFDKLVDKATSQILLEPDWDSILQICDAIRMSDIQPKFALTSLRRKIYAENPHVAKFALQTLESVVKNCGSIIHEEIATKDFMEFLKELVKLRSDPVKAKILELIQVWSHAFRGEPSYKIVEDTYHLMKMEGYTFPTLNEADIMFKAEKAPEWKDGEHCFRCRSSFGVMTRKHHCRNCGQVFCNKCSSKNSIIPKYGYEREVRVCDACFDELNKGGAAASKKSSDDSLPAEYLASPLAQQTQTPAKKSEQELQEEEELQLALAISESEAESKVKEKMRLTSSYGRSAASSSPAAPTITAQVAAPTFDASEMDPELARYLNRNYWQQKQNELKTAAPPVTSTTTPSAPVISSEPVNTTVHRVQEQFQNGVESGDTDKAEFLKAMRSSIEIFVNRMKSNSSRGRHISNDSAVQTFFITLSQMHPELLKHIHEQEDKRAQYESLQDKLAQLKDAREALNALREDQKEKRRREAEEQERLRQIQMAQKLEVMRQKKQEYLEYQRQLAIQRMQEQEREMAIRLEQQKQMAQMRQMQAYSSPYQNYPGGGYDPGMEGPQSVPGIVTQPGSMPPSVSTQNTAPPGSMAPGQYPQMYNQGQQYGQTAPYQQNYTPPYQSPGGPQGYQSPQSSMDYNAYNMQGMKNALSGQGVQLPQGAPYGSMQPPPGGQALQYGSPPQSQSLPAMGGPYGTTQPPGTQSMPQGTQSIAQGTPGMPQGTPGFPQGTQGIPQGAPGIPQGAPGIPQGQVQGVTGPTQGSPYGTGLPQATQVVTSQGGPYGTGPPQNIPYGTNQPQSGQYATGQPQGIPGMVPGQAMPPGGGSYGAPPDQYQQAPPPTTEAQLISFD